MVTITLNNLIIPILSCLIKLRSLKRILIIKNLPGVRRCEKNEQGVLEVFGDKTTAFGSTLEFHYQSNAALSNRTIRTHGGEAESLIPLAFLFEMDSDVNNQFLQTPRLYNKDLFFFLCK